LEKEKPKLIVKNEYEKLKENLDLVLDKN